MPGKESRRCGRESPGGTPRPPAPPLALSAGRGAASAPAHHLSPPPGFRSSFSKSGAIWTHRSFLIKALHHSFSDAGAARGTGSQHAPDNPPPFKKEGRGRRKRAKGEITTVCSCNKLAQRQLGETTYAHSPPLHPDGFWGGWGVELPPFPPPNPPPPMLGRAAASCPDLALPLPPVGNFPKCHRITLLILFGAPAFKFCRWAGEERREGGREGGRGGEGRGERGGGGGGGGTGRGWPLNANQPGAAGLLGDGSWEPPARRQERLHVPRTPRRLPVRGGGGGGLRRPHPAALASRSALTRGTPRGMPSEGAGGVISPPAGILWTRREKIFGGQRGGSPWGFGPG